MCPGPNPANLRAHPGDSAPPESRSSLERESASRLGIDGQRFSQPPPPSPNRTSKAQLALS